MLSRGEFVVQHTHPATCVWRRRMRRAIVSAVMAAGLHGAGVAPAQSIVPVNTAPRVFWKQKLFSIPYRLNRAQDSPDAPVEVQLFVSSDLGDSWKQISRARPEVLHFTYSAEQDGEYWFAVRTVDAKGQVHPTGGHTPQLCVVVDTTPPQLKLSAVYDERGSVEFTWEIIDENPDPRSLAFKAKTSQHLAWQSIVLPTTEFESGPATNRGSTSWPVPPQSTPEVIRGETTDLAGNWTVVQAQVTTAAESAASGPEFSSVAGPIFGKAHEPVDGPPNAAAPEIGTLAAPGANPPGHREAAAIRPPDASVSRVEVPLSPTGPPATQSVLRPERPPFTPPQTVSNPNTGVASDPAAARFDSEPASNLPAIAPSIPVLRRGSVQINPYATRTSPPPALSEAGPQEQRTQLPVPPLIRRNNSAASSQPNADAPRTNAEAPQPRANWPNPPTRPYTPIPSRGSTSVLTPPSIVTAPEPSQANRDATQPTTPSGWMPDDNSSSLESPVARMVNSRRFALDYELNAIGPSGIAAVELWGTADGGRNWRLFAKDDDNRSPIEAVVEREGEFGFKLLVQSAGGYGTPPPEPGTRPDMVVRVDLVSPTVSLTGVHLGTGNLTDHIVVRWKAEDDFLDRRPVTLSYASRPNGPWTIIATDLENTGYYAWRLQRHIPESLYIRAEVRDQAGNAGVFQMADPFVVRRPRPSGLLRDVRPVD